MDEFDFDDEEDGCEHRASNNYDGLGRRGRADGALFSDDEYEEEGDLEAQLDLHLGISDNQETARDMQDNCSESEEYQLGAQDVFAQAASLMTAEQAGRHFPDAMSETGSLNSMPSVGAVDGHE